VLTQLGYRFVAEVRKQRTIYRLDKKGFHVEVCQDEVCELGRFVELEIAAVAELLEAAQAVLRDIAAGLGLSANERRSYLELLLERRAGAGQAS